MIVILSHCGSHVPADQAYIPVRVILNDKLSFLRPALHSQSQHALARVDSAGLSWFCVKDL